MTGIRRTAATTPDRRSAALSALWRAALALLLLCGIGLLPWLSRTDPARTVLKARAADRDPTPEVLESIRRDLNLDAGPLHLLGQWLGGLAHGDAGTSWLSGTAVTPMVAQGLGCSLLLMAGALVVAVADGDSLDVLSASKSFVPKDVAELVRTINRVKKDDRLYVETYRVTSGAVIGSNELPNLPPSVLATLNNDRTAGGFLPRMITALSSQEFPLSEYVISGSQALTIQVVR